MRAAGAALAVFGLVLCIWGVGLIVKAATGGVPDSNTTAIVGIGVVIAAIGLGFAVTAVRMIGRWRR